MTTERDLVAAICATPDEDTPRLAFADWLDEQGGGENADRAAFVRAQVELAALPPEDDDAAMTARRCVLTRTSENLLRKHTKTWGRRNKAVGTGRRGGLGFGSSFRRGFLEFPAGPIGAYLSLPDGPFPCHPVAAVRVRDVTPPPLLEFLARPWLDRVRSLELDCWNRPDYSFSDGDAIGRCDRLSRLADLTLLYGVFRGPGAPPGALPALRSLTVEQWKNEYDPMGRVVEFLPHDRLESLDMGPQWWSPAELFAALGSPKLRNLRRLYLPHSCGRVTSLDALAAAAFWPNLRSADVVWAYDRWTAPLRGLPWSPALRRVRFWGGGEHEVEHVRSIADSPYLGTVTGLSFYGGFTGPDPLAELLASPYLDNLTDLDLSTCEIGPDGARLLAAAP